MADITEEIQNAIDTVGAYTLPAGTSQISSTVTLNGSTYAWIRGRASSVLEWTGAANSTMFNWANQISNAKKPFFHHVEAYSEVDGTCIFRAYDGRPHNLVMSECTFTATGAYPIDIDECDYTVPMRFENMRTFGSGAARLRSTKGGAEGYWLTSLMEIKNWVHVGSNRVGPAFDLLGVRGTKLMNIWDKGDPSLLPALVGNWAAPVSLRWNCVGFPSSIVNYIVEYDQDFTNAPGCYLHEIRTDSGYALGQHEQLNISGMTMHDYNIDPGVAHVRLMGGNGTPAAHGLMVKFDACEDLDGDKFLCGGKLLVRCENIWYNPGQEAKEASMRALCEAMDPDAFRRPIMTATDRPPRDEIRLPLYVGSDLEAAREDDVGDYETVLEGLP